MVLPICRLAPPASGPLDRLPRIGATARVSPRAPMPDVGAVVFLTHKKESAEAILDREGRWRCPKLPVLERPLNALYTPARFPGVGMPFGYAALIEAAAWLKGEARPDRDSRGGPSPG